MYYCKIDDNITYVHLRTIMQWLIDEVRSASGDGDGIWYSEYYMVKDLIGIATDIMPESWNVLDQSDETFSIGADQEALIVTNNKELFDKRPHWQQVALDY